MPDNNTANSNNTQGGSNSANAGASAAAPKEASAQPDKQVEQQQANSNSSNEQPNKSQQDASQKQTGEKKEDSPEILLSEDADGKKEGDKDDKKAESTEDYKDFRLPEGMTLEGEKLAEAKSLMKKWGLKQEQAQEAVEYVANMVKAQSEAVKSKVDTMWSDTVKEWGKATKNDKEVGLANYKENREYAIRALKNLNPEFKQLLMEGLSNHPGVFKHLVQLGKEHSEDNPSQSNTGGGAELSKEDAFKKALFGAYPGRAETRK